MPRLHGAPGLLAPCNVYLLRMRWSPCRTPHSFRQSTPLGGLVEGKRLGAMLRFERIAVNVSTFVVLAIVVVLFILAVRACKNGSASDCSSCGGNCSSGNCSTCNVTAKLLEDMDRADRAAKTAVPKGR